MHYPLNLCSSKYISVSGFGFLASKEVREAGIGNLGLQDRK